MKKGLGIIGTSLLILSVIMFITGVGAFTLQGPMNWFMATFGNFSFSYWFSTFVFSIAFIFASTILKKD